MYTSLGERMKEQYEFRTRYFLPRRTYTIVRVDGKAFHTYTENCFKPFDLGLIAAMVEAAKALIAEIQGARFSYVQSDEISVLVTDFDKPETDAWFDGNLQKIVSVSASIATAAFNRSWFSQEETKWAHFDSRAFIIPDPIEVENYFIWRQKDWERNSLQMFARSFFTDKELHGKDHEAIHEMLHSKGENWSNLESYLKRGKFIDREGQINPPVFTQDRGFLRSRVPLYEGARWPVIREEGGEIKWNPM